MKKRMDLFGVLSAKKGTLKHLSRIIIMKVRLLGTLSYFLTVVLTTGCTDYNTEKKVVLAIPVYGQSLALGEEAIRITDFGAFTDYCKHRVLTENLDEAFGYLSDNAFKQWLKKMISDRRRAFELSIYGMSEALSDYLNTSGVNDVLICTFPGGMGATSVQDLGRGSIAYEKFLNELKKAYKNSRRRNFDFYVPAFCWMQGETDVIVKTSNYREKLKTFHTELNEDIKAITGQPNDVVCISYQTNCLALSQNFDANRFDFKETAVPQGQMELIRDDSLFVASGPTYPYTFVNEDVHIDGVSQKRLGYLAGLSVIRLLESQPNKGLIPARFDIVADTVMIQFEAEYLPLVLDTLAVDKVRNYGFSVIDSTDTDILKEVFVKDNVVKLLCRFNPIGAKARYAVNGFPKKNGSRHGPRGNLRDSQGEKLKAKILDQDYPLHNWCYQFDVALN